MTEAALPFSLKDRVAIVTGSGRGIGREIAGVFARAGAQVVVATRTAASGEETVRLIEEEGGTAKLITVDLAQSADAFSLVEETVRLFGRLDILVHNAGVYSPASMDDMTEEELEATLNVNLKAAFWLSKAAAPILRNSPSPRLLFTSSLGGPRIGVPNMVHYGASKSGINGFIKGAAVEYGKYGITVNGVEPGGIVTDALSFATPEQLEAAGAATPVGRLGQPDDIAYAMLYLASDQSCYMTGQTMVVDGGASLTIAS